MMKNFILNSVVGHNPKRLFSNKATLLFLIIVISLNLTTLISFADLGLTKEEAVKRFGPHDKKAEKNDVKGDWYIYRKGVWVIMLVFDKDGKSRFCSYSLPINAEFPENFIQEIIKRNEKITGKLSEIPLSLEAAKLGVDKSGLPEQTKEKILKLPQTSRVWVSIANIYLASFNKEDKTLLIYKNE